MSNKPKILIFSLAYGPHWGGAEVAVKEITNRLGEEYDFSMITWGFGEDLPPQEKIGNINVYRVGGSKLFFSFRAFLKARKLHKENKYNVVWSIMANRAGLATLFFKLLNPKVKFLLTLQEGDKIDHPKNQAGFLWIFIRPLFKMIFTRADKIQAISSYLAKWGESRGGKNIEVVPNGVDTNNFQFSISNFQKEELRKKLGIGLDEKVVITTSRLVTKNGIADLIEAVKDLDVKLLILGEGEERKALESKINGKVLMLGDISQEKIPEYLMASDIFIRPSLSEGLGISFLEAMAVGLPVIATPVGGIPDFLKDRETGLFCEVNNPKSIAEKIKELIDNPELAKKIAHKGQKLVSESYNWETICIKMGEIFKSLV